MGDVRRGRSHHRRANHEPAARRETRKRTSTHRPADEPATAEGLLALQSLAGNDAVQRMLGADVAVQRKVEKIGDENVQVANDKEKAEAEAILKRVKDLYGVEVSSATTIAGIKAEYGDVKASVKNKLKARTWRMVELRSLEKALKYYAAILGAERAKSTRKGADQEVTSVGKVTQAIDENTPAGKLDTSTLGEYFETKKNMGLFKASEGYKSDFSSEKDQLTGTFVHEIAHGLLAYAIPDYITKTGYWKDEYTKLSKSKQVEAPVTSYGKTSAAEDICESAMMYFLRPERLKKKCPKRYAFMEALGKAWLPPPAKAPQVAPSAATITDVAAAVTQIATSTATAINTAAAMTGAVADVLADVHKLVVKVAEESQKPPEGSSGTTA